ncbi:AMP deaminase 2 [Trypanosoma rangeli SC58]|uniref:AMP deaminase 2 n=1 Tax=Trypanosoma rangeli SC58 TaxID=429131 RepID=A0A061IUL9_TRYRA|nr:AMP deaminase 2 [Trypanosoma rangeli SC58]
MYHMWANIYSLNEFRRRRKFSTFTFRPSCGETGPVDHLIGGFLLANAINYGVTLADDAPLQYLFYLARIGVTVSPLSNNTKVLGYLDNPFPHFFRRGLMVSLSTDSPLMFHHTQEPLLEEYSIASKVWKLGPNDMCEIARNSVLLSGFDTVFKRERLGDLYFLSSSRSNDASRTHLSDIRVAYRFETYHSEIALLELICGLKFPKALLTLSEESAREAEFLEADKKKKEVAIGGIIDPQPLEADIDGLQQQRALVQNQLEELSKALIGLQRQNKQLTEKLADEIARDQQAAQLRRRSFEDRLDQLMESEAKDRSAVAMAHFDDVSLGRLPGSTVPSAGGSPAASPSRAAAARGSGAEDTNKSNSQQQEQEQEEPQRSEVQSWAHNAPMPFNVPNAVGPTVGGANSSNAMGSDTLCTDPKRVAAVTTALVNFQESMWSRDNNSGGPYAFPEEVASRQGVNNSLLLPRLNTDPLHAGGSSSSPEGSRSVTKQLATLPHRQPRDLALQRPPVVLPRFFE